MQQQQEAAGTSSSPFHQPVLQGVPAPAEVQRGGSVLGGEARTRPGREDRTLIQDQGGGRASVQLHLLLGDDTQVLLLQEEEQNFTLALLHNQNQVKPIFN